MYYKKILGQKHALEMDPPQKALSFLYIVTAVKERIQ